MIIIGIILIVLAVILFLIAQWSRGYSPRPSTLTAPPTPPTTPTTTAAPAKPTNWTPLKWLAIIGAIIIIVLIGKSCVMDIAYGPEDSRFKPIKTIYYTPNIWTPENFAWLMNALYLEPGKYRIEVSGFYLKCFFSPDGKIRYMQRIGPEGIQNWKPPYDDRLPISGYPPGMFIGRINCTIIPMGTAWETTIDKRTWMDFNINFPQDYTDVEGSNPSMNFVLNEGSLKVTIKQLVQ